MNFKLAKTLFNLSLLEEEDLEGVWVESGNMTERFLTTLDILKITSDSEDFYNFACDRKLRTLLTDNWKVSWH